MQKLVKKSFRHGFTMIELSISILFISVLAITIAVMTVNLINAYQRGITLKELNTVSTELIDDLRTAISNSSAKSLTEVCKTVYSEGDARTDCVEDNAYAFAYFVKTANVTLYNNNNATISVPIQGGFCSGTYSYIWNSGYFFSDTEYKVENTNRLSFEYKYSTEDNSRTETDFRLLKILDPSRSVCIAATTASSSLSSISAYPSKTIQDSEIDISGFSALSEIPTDLFSEGNSQNLAIYNLYIDAPAQDSESRNLLISGSFILGTVRGGLNINASGSYCSTPDNYFSDLNYCAINKFNFAARATGE